VFRTGVGGAVTVIERGAGGGGGGGGGGVGITVRFATASTLVPEDAANASTEYVAGEVPAGTDFIIPVDARDAGATVTTL
jgi:hypothetical protein